MAVLYVFPVAGTEFIQLNNQNNDYITSIHYAELSFGLDNNGNVQFSHRRESAQLFPIQAAPFAEVLDEAGTPYSAVSLNAFIAAFTAAMPLAGSGGGISPSGIGTFTLKVIAGVTVYNTSASAREVQVTALAGTFDVTDTSGSSNVQTFPITTVGGNIIESFSIAAGDFKLLSAIQIDVPAAATVLIYERF